MNRKLQKQKAKNEKEREELYEKWKMGDKSKKILEDRERRLQTLGLDAGETPPRAADRRGVELTPEHNNHAIKKATFRKSTCRKII